MKMLFLFTKVSWTLCHMIWLTVTDNKKFDFVIIETLDNI